MSVYNKLAGQSTIGMQILSFNKVGQQKQNYESSNKKRNNFKQKKGTISEIFSSPRNISNIQIVSLKEPITIKPSDKSETPAYRLVDKQNKWPQPETKVHGMQQRSGAPSNMAQGKRARISSELPRSPVANGISNSLMKAASYKNKRVDKSKTPGIKGTKSIRDLRPMQEDRIEGVKVPFSNENKIVSGQITMNFGEVLEAQYIDSQNNFASKKNLNEHQKQFKVSNENVRKGSQVSGKISVTNLTTVQQTSKHRPGGSAYFSSKTVSQGRTSQIQQQISKPYQNLTGMVVFNHNNGEYPPSNSDNQTLMDQQFQYPAFTQMLSKEQAATLKHNGPHISINNLHGEVRKNQSGKVARKHHHDQPESLEVGNLDIKGSQQQLQIKIGKQRSAKVEISRERVSKAKPYNDIGAQLAIDSSLMNQSDYSRKACLLSNQQIKQKNQIQLLQLENIKNSSDLKNDDRAGFGVQTAKLNSGLSPSKTLLDLPLMKESCTNSPSMSHNHSMVKIHDTPDGRLNLSNPEIKQKNSRHLNSFVQTDQPLYVSAVRSSEDDNRDSLQLCQTNKVIQGSLKTSMLTNGKRGEQLDMSKRQTSSVVQNDCFTLQDDQKNLIFKTHLSFENQNDCADTLDQQRGLLQTQTYFEKTPADGIFGAASQQAHHGANSSIDQNNQKYLELLQKINNSNLSSQNKEYQRQLIQFLHSQHSESSSRNPKQQFQKPSHQPLNQNAPVKGLRSQSAVNRLTSDSKQLPIFINHGDINININLNNPTAADQKILDQQNIKQFILNNFQEQLQGEKPHTSGGKRTQNFGGTHNQMAMSQPASSMFVSYNGLSKPMSGQSMDKTMSFKQNQMQYPSVQSVNGQQFGKSFKILKQTPALNQTQTSIGSHQMQSQQYPNPQFLTGTQLPHKTTYGNTSIFTQPIGSLCNSIAPTTQQINQKNQQLQQLLNQQLPPQTMMQNSKQTNQLKKQIVQFCWQNLINNYSADKFKLDVKGKAVAGQQLLMDQQHAQGLYNNGSAFVTMQNQFPSGKIHSANNKQSMSQAPLDIRLLQQQYQNQQQLVINRNCQSNTNMTYHQNQSKQTRLQTTRTDQMPHSLKSDESLPHDVLSLDMSKDLKHQMHQQQLQQHLNYLSQLYAEAQIKNKLANVDQNALNLSFLTALPPHFQHLFVNGQHSRDCKCFKILQLKQQQLQLQLTLQKHDPSVVFQNQLLLQQIQLNQQLAAPLGLLFDTDSQKPEQSTSNQQAQKQNPSKQPSKPQKQSPIKQLTNQQQINQFIKKLNELINLTLKATDSINPLQLNQIKKVGQDLGIKWQSYIDPKFIKSKDFVTFLKSKVYVLLNNLLLKGNFSLYQQIQMVHQYNQVVQGKQQLKGEEGKTPTTCEADQPNINFVHANLHWINQIQLYNMLKFKNQGFKFWIEWPTVWGNNFIVVKQVTKRRNWLSWVDYDPYEEKPAMVETFSSPQDQTPKLNKASASKGQTQKQSLEPQSQSQDKKSKKPNKRGESKDLEKQDRRPEPEPAEPVPVPRQAMPLSVSLPNLLMTQIRRISIIKDLLPHQIYNHIDGINQVAMKCQLHKNMETFARENNINPLSIMPETYIIELQKQMNSKYILEHPQFKKFQQAFTKDSWWILKPGEDANRGNGIKVFDKMDKIQQFITYSFNSGQKQYRTCIIQKYMEKPLLVYRRKFDIRVFALLTYNANFEKMEGSLRGWFYEEGYIRTSCKEYNLSTGGADNTFMHLTNDAVQKQSADYGKYEAGNKISYSDFDKILQKEYQVSFYNKILPQIKNKVSQTFKAAGKRLVGEIRSDYNGFEWLGFDFMLTEDMKLQMIEVNTNPCLETMTCILLQRLIPQMLDQSLKIAVDPFFGASEHQYLMNQEFVATEIKYSLVFETTIENIKSTPSYEMDELYYYQSQKNETNDIEQNLIAREEQHDEPDQPEEVEQDEEVEEDTLE